MSPLILKFGVFILYFIVSLKGTSWVIDYLLKNNILDHPNIRSSHQNPTPRGGGLVIIPLMVSGFLFFYPLSYSLLSLIFAIIILFFISWVDDRQGLKPLPRLMIHCLASIFGLMMIDQENLIFQGLVPFWSDRILSFFILVWFINLFNFMDGINGLAASESIFIALGISLICKDNEQNIGIIIIAISLGFLYWNKSPAKIFLGDTGSIPLGFILGLLLLKMASTGYWAAALILPSYYLSDASLTLISRLMKKQKIWQAHKSHFYQKAVQGRCSHMQVVKYISMGNILLVGWALLSLAVPIFSLLGAGTTLIILLIGLSKMSQAQS